MPNRHWALEHLRKAILQGAALASVSVISGCVQPAVESIDAGVADSGSFDAGSADSGVVDAGDVDSGVPALDSGQPWDPAELGCRGGDGKTADGGDWHPGDPYPNWPCCTAANRHDVVVNSDGGGPRCPTATEVYGSLVGYGSGMCLCKISDAGVFGISGPYSGESVAATDGGACYFLIGTQTCVGRPLVVEGQAVLAPLSARSDWAAGV